MAADECGSGGYNLLLSRKRCLLRMERVGVMFATLLAGAVRLGGSRSSRQTVRWKTKKITRQQGGKAAEFRFDEDRAMWFLKERSGILSLIRIADTGALSQQAK